MVHYPRLAPRAWRSTLVFATVVGAAAAIGCSHNNPSPDDDIPIIPAAPIVVHVKNENFADVNVAVVVSSVSRRLGTVSGNTSDDFAISYNTVNGQPVVITARQIGGNGYATSPNLSVGPGQVIEFKVGSVFRQSTAVVHDP
ncbi:MAG: hypothetical protein ABI442_07260 [Gemmatimonadaceae bacterium]